MWQNCNWFALLLLSWVAHSDINANEMTNITYRKVKCINCKKKGRYRHRLCGYCRFKNKDRTLKRPKPLPGLQKHNYKVESRKHRFIEIAYK